MIHESLTIWYIQIFRAYGLNYLGRRHEVNGPLFGTFFEGMGHTKVRSPALSRDFTNKDTLKFGSHMLSRSQSSKNNIKMPSEAVWPQFWSLSASHFWRDGLHKSEEPAAVMTLRKTNGHVGLGWLIFLGIKNQFQEDYSSLSDLSTEVYWAIALLLSTSERLPALWHQRLSMFKAQGSNQRST